MTDLQAWVNSKYPTKKDKEQVRDLFLNKPDLIGELDLSEFRNQYRNCYTVSISQLVNESKIILKNKPEKIEIIKCSDAQKEFDYEFPTNEVCLGKFDQEEEIFSNGARQKEIKNWGKTRAEIREIYVNEESLEGSLIVEDFPNLKEFKCSINKITSLKFLKCPKIKKVNCYNNEITQLPIFSHPQVLKELFIHFNRLKENLDLNNFSDLEVLNCCKNYLSSLIITDCQRLSALYCSNNKLTKLIIVNSPNLAKIDVYNNELIDLTIFSHLSNLKDLSIGKNNFSGSLAPLAKLTNLEDLDISNTNLTTDLESLPASLEKIDCDDTFLEEEFALYNGNFKAWKENWEKDQQLSHPNKKGRKSNLEGISIAPFISNEKIIKVQENYSSAKSYRKIKGSEDKINHWNKLKKNSLPTKLYQISTNTVVWTKNATNIDSYAILSYVWGDIKKETAEGKLVNWSYFYHKENGKVIEKRVGVSSDGKYAGTTQWSKKSFDKAISACQLLNIDFLWMDQLCINQFDVEEVNCEVPKMRQYYSNTVVTLIPIQCDLGKKNAIDVITSSKWFTRSWTFQEGWLSKHTIFLFDDLAFDGRELAVNWVLRQPAYSEYATINPSEREEASVKVATPIGWVYFREGYESEDKISLTLSQALRGVRERQRFLSIDGIYSILGLLPYGEQVKPKYQKWDYQYTQLELLEALYDVIKVAWEQDYGEALGWHGAGHSIVPAIRSVQEGSIEIAGGIFIKQMLSSKDSSLTAEGLKLNAYQCMIKIIAEKIVSIEEEEDKGFLIDSGLCTKSVQMKVDGDKLEEIKLWGTRETLEKIQIDHTLLIPDPKEWKSNIPFGLLAQKQGNIYQRIGLVEIRNKIEKLTVGIVENVTISLHEYIEAKKLKRVATILEQESFKKVRENNSHVVDKSVQTDVTNENLRAQTVELEQLRKQVTELECQIQTIMNNSWN